MGQLRRRGRVWFVRYYRDGRQYEQSTKSEKKGDAIRLLRLLEGDIERGVAVTPRIGKLRFSEAATDLVNDYRVNGKRSIDELQRRIDKHLGPYFAHRRMASITTADVRAYIAKRQSETEITRKAYDIHLKDGRVRRIPELRRTVAGVSNAE